MSENKYPQAGGIFYACFNAWSGDVRAGFAAVRARFGEDGVRKVKKINKTGILAMFHVPPTPETELHANTIAARVEARYVKEGQWFYGKPEESAEVRCE